MELLQPLGSHTGASWVVLGLNEAKDGLRLSRCRLGRHACIENSKFDALLMSGESSVALASAAYHRIFDLLWSHYLIILDKEITYFQVWYVNKILILRILLL